MEFEHQRCQRWALPPSAPSVSCVAALLEQSLLTTHASVQHGVPTRPLPRSLFTPCGTLVPPSGTQRASLCL